MLVTNLLDPIGETQDQSLLSPKEIFKISQEVEQPSTDPEPEPEPVPKPTLIEIRSALQTTLNYLHHNTSPLSNEVGNLLD
jgi:hypothetical protein